MRLGLRGDSVVERLALRAGVVPVPAAQAWGGMALSGVVIAAAELGVTARLAAGPATAEELATELGLEPLPTRLLLECLRSTGHLTRRRGSYRLTRAARRWLDPRAPRSVSQFVASASDYWAWWARLPEVVRDGVPVGHHEADPDDAYWRRYIAGQHELARLTAGAVARRVAMPREARAVLDVGGGHGWYSVALCRRHRRLSSTVLDLPGSARVGREIVAAAGFADRVRHREGDALTADLAGPYDAVLCFNVIHHLGPDDVPGLFRRIWAALRPHGTFAVLDGFVDPSRRGSAAGDLLGLFTYLSSGSRSYPPAQLEAWLAGAGFTRPRRSALRPIPGLTLYQARALPRGPLSRSDTGMN